MANELATVTKLRDLANAKIEAWGSDIPVKTKTGSAYDIGTGTNTPTYDNDNIKADISSYQIEELSSLILAQDIKLMIKYEDRTKVVTESILTIDSIEYKIINIDPEIKLNIGMFVIIQARK